MRSYLLLALAVACDAGARAPAPAPLSSTVAPAKANAPTGWVPIQMTDDLRSCGNKSDDEWHVAIDPHGDVVVTKAPQREGDTGPDLPFEAKADGAAGEMRGRRHTLAFGDGYLVGFDAGEWGGGLFAYAHDGSGRVVLGDTNVHGLVATGPDVAISLEGLAHLSINEGAVRWIERAGGAVRATKPVRLPDVPLTSAIASDGTVYVITWSSLVKITPDRRVQIVQKVRTEHLYSDSMAIDPDGALWIGMRQFVLRLAPGRDTFTETWFTRASCQRMEAVDLNCICR